MIWPFLLMILLGLPLGGVDDQRFAKALILLYTQDANAVEPAATLISTTGGPITASTLAVTLPLTVVESSTLPSGTNLVAASTTMRAVQTTSSTVDNATLTSTVREGSTSTTTSDAAQVSSTSLSVPSISKSVLFKVVASCGAIILIVAVLMLANIKWSQCPIPAMRVRQRSQAPTAHYRSTAVASSVQFRQPRRRATADQLSLNPWDADPVPPYASTLSLAIRNVGIIVGSTLAAMPAPNRAMPGPEVALQPLNLPQGPPPAYLQCQGATLRTVEEVATDHAETSDDGSSESSSVVGDEPTPVESVVQRDEPLPTEAYATLP